MSAAGGSHWQDIQQNTFTRWVNQHVNRRGYHVNDLGKDLKDGIILCNLLEIISQKSLGRWNKNPKVPQQKLENCQIAVDFIQAEGIKLVNISGSDINDCRLKLILGLIWTLILRYQIHQGADGAEDELLRWVRSKIPEYNIQNFTKDWNDGKAICALVNALRPGLCPNHASLSSSDSLGNATTGITLGAEKLGVAALILPSEMVHPKVDKLAMMTYISQYRDLKDFTDADRCQAFGHGLNNGIVGIPSNFTVVVPPGSSGKLEVRVIGPHSEAKVDIKNDNGKYSVTYTPTEPGIYKVHVTLDKKHIPGSIFTVVVLEQESLGGEGKIRVFFSTTSSSEKGRSDNFKLEQLLTTKKIHLRPDFEPWIPVDIMDREDREAVFRKAGTRALPIVFIDDKYAGDYDTMAHHEETGKLNQLINMMGYEKQGYNAAPPPKTDELKKPTLDSTSSTGAPTVASVTKTFKTVQVSPPATNTAPPTVTVSGGMRFCPNCGTKAGAGAFCGDCGTKLA